MRVKEKYVNKYKDLYMLINPPEEYVDFFNRYTKFKKGLDKDTNKKIAKTLKDEFIEEKYIDIENVFKEYESNVNYLINSYFKKDVTSSIEITYLKSRITSNRASKTLNSIKLSIPSILLSAKMYDVSVETMFKTVYLHEMGHLLNFQDRTYVDRFTKLYNINHSDIRLSLNEFIDYCNTSFYNEVYASEFATIISEDICHDYLEICLYTHWTNNLMKVIMFDDYKVDYVKHGSFRFVNTDI